MTEADRTLPARVRTSWRWRIVVLRALIDAELVRRESRVSEKCVAAFRELTTLYHAERGYDGISPPRNLTGVVPA